MFFYCFAPHWLVIKFAPTRVMEVTTSFLETPNQVSVLFEIKCSHTSASSAPQKWSTVCSTLVGELDLNYNRLTYWYFMYMHVQFQAYILKVWSVMGILTNIAKKVPSAGAKKCHIILQLDHKWNFPPRPLAEQVDVTGPFAEQAQQVDKKNILYCIQYLGIFNINIVYNT